jgi:hypothetical protein
MTVYVLGHLLLYFLVSPTYLMCCSFIGTVPSIRGETPIVYDAKQSRIIVFGGWANRSVSYQPVRDHVV